MVLGPTLWLVYIQANSTPYSGQFTNNKLYEIKSRNKISSPSPSVKIQSKGTNVRSAAEKNYAVVELLAIQWAVHKCRIAACTSLEHSLQLYSSN